MQIKLIGGGGSFYGPHGIMVSYGPNSVIDVDDGDEASVTYWQERVDSGAAELIEAPSKAAAETEEAEEESAEEEEEAEEEPAEAEEEPAEVESTAPPMGGPGSGRDAWVAYAETLGVEVTDDMTRDDIVAAVEAKS
jgi:hypothetical protein